MKALLCSTLLLITAPALAIDDTKPVEATDAKNNEAVVVLEAAGEPGQNVRVVRVNGDAGTAASGNEFVIKVAVNGEDGEDVDVVKHAHIFAEARVADEAGNPNRGWLGVYLGAVSTKDAQANGIDGGVQILNVIKESPAEAAGLEKGDIVTAINGEPVTDGIGSLSKAIGDLGPGSDARISVIRDGQALELTATLGAPQHGRIELLHSPDVDFANHFRFGPKVLRLQKSDDGSGFTFDHDFNWTQLPEALQGLENLNAEFDLSFDNGERKINIKSVENGEVLSISQEDDGPITVSRFTEGHEDDAEAFEYVDAEALKAADEEAFELYENHNSHSFVSFRAGKNGVADFTFSADKMDFLHDDLMKRLEIKLDGLEDIAGDVNGQVHDAIVQLHGAGGPGGAHAFFMGANKASQSFRVNPDGEIELTIRKGDAEIVKVYSDERDLEARNPEAFEKYSDVLNADTE